MLDERKKVWVTDFFVELNVGAHLARTPGGDILGALIYCFVLFFAYLKSVCIFSFKKNQFSNSVNYL